MTDTETENRRAMCASVKPAPIAAIVQRMAGEMRLPISIAFALLQRGLYATIEEAERAAWRYYPRP